MGKIISLSGLKYFLLFVTFFLTTLISCVTYANHTPLFKPYLYFGPSIGYGSTNWDMLVTTEDDPAASSAPISAKDKGGVVGVVMGYQFTPAFGLEADYMHFSDSTITFIPYSFYSPYDPDYLVVRSKTSAVALFGKFTIPFAHYFAAFANAGIEITMRKDSLACKTSPGGVFGIGLMYFFSKHVLTQVAFQFYTGYGKSETRPALDFIPFLWQVHAVIAYRIPI